MQPNPQFWAHRRVCVTGGTGFLGWQLAQQLVPLTAQVRILGLTPASPSLRSKLRAYDCTFADVRDAGAVKHAMRDCDIVFHAAGPVATWGPGLKQVQAIHVGGTQNILNALPAGARLVHTSSVVTIGASVGEEILTETARFNLQRLRVDYVHAKKAAEEVALDAAARGAEIVVVNPGYLIGPDDEEESVMGRICLRFWRGKLPFVPAGALSFVDVRDVALGQLLAAERGRSGTRYILAGENRTMADFAACLAEVSGLAKRRFTLPAWLQSAVACLAECRALFMRREPFPSRQSARLSQYSWYYSSQRAQSELGYHARPMRESLADTFRWFLSHGWLKKMTASHSGSPETSVREV